MQQEHVRRRLVVHLGGYDPLSPEATHRRFARELRRFEATWSARAEATPADISADLIAWKVAASGAGWVVETEMRVLRWDDVMASAAARPAWRRLWLGLWAFADFVVGGAFFGYARRAWRYACFFLYPFLLLAAFGAAGAVVGAALAGLTGSALAGIAGGALLFGLLLRWPGRRLYLWHLLDDWDFARASVRRTHPVIGARLDRLAADLVAASRDGRTDEILVVGHSLGAVLAVELIERALRIEPGLGLAGPPVVLLTVGSSLLKVGLHRAARPLREALVRLASAPGILWAEYQVLIDVMNFYKQDPIKILRLSAPRGPVIKVVRISRMLDYAYYIRMKYDFFRVHNQFVSGNDQRANYDYFMFVCGPLAAERQITDPAGAASAFAPNGALILASADTQARQAVS